MAVTYPSKPTVFLTAEALRNETGNKTTIMGAFGGGDILVPPNTTFPVNFPFAVYAVFEDGEGNFKTRLRILDPDGKPVAPDFDLGNSLKKPGQPLQVMVNFNVFQFPKPGSYTIDIIFDDKVYPNRICIRHGDNPVS